MRAQRPSPQRTARKPVQPEPRASERVCAVGLERGQGLRARARCLGFLLSAIKSLYVPSRGEAASDDQHGKISQEGCGERWAWGEN